MVNTYPIGHRVMACRGRKDVLPVRIAASAFGDGRPARDLFVSPAHAIAVDILGAVLIPACRLINGTTITQVDVEEVTYWHVELDSHDLLIADGLPAENYLDCGNRRFFANVDVTDLAALPDARPEEPLPFCRPFRGDGPLVDLIRARLDDRAAALGWCKVEDAFAGMHLVADGRTIRPDVAGLDARFVLPVTARDVRLVSATSVPAHVRPGSTDDRRLGLPLAALTIDDGLTGARAIAPGRRPPRRGLPRRQRQRSLDQWIGGAPGRSMGGLRGFVLPAGRARRSGFAPVSRAGRDGRSRRSG